MILNQNMESQERRKTTERIVPEQSESDLEYLLYLRHVFAYDFSRNYVTDPCRLLEVGCGDGYGTEYLAEKCPNVTLTAIDPNADTIKFAQNKYTRESISFVQYNSDKIPYDESAFDVIISFQVIEHVENDYAFIKEIHRVLKTGGVFIVTTPNRIHRLKPGQRSWNPYHVREYYPQELVSLLERCFLSVEGKGVVGNEDIQQLEISRVQAKIKGPRLFCNNLFRSFRRALSRCVPRSVKESIRKKTEPSENSSLRDRFKLEDYSIICDELERSLDILCVCRK